MTVVSSITGFHILRLFMGVEAVFVIQQYTLQDDGRHHYFISKKNGRFSTEVCGQFRHRVYRLVSVFELSIEFFFLFARVEC
jgi:hypothetical protein